MQKLSWVSTVVGSFPYEDTPQNMILALEDQITCGIDYPCYPQLIGMVEQFLNPLVEQKIGLEKQKNHYIIPSELRLPSKPVATEYGEFMIKYLQTHPDQQPQIKGWKACLTGPFTLASDIIVPPELVHHQAPILYPEPRAIMSEEILRILAQIMAQIAQVYSSMGATIISMDEPTLGLIVGKKTILYHSDDTIIDILNMAIAPIQKYASVHICGRISPRLRDMLLQSNVKILDHEFQKSNNDEVFTRQMFDQSNKSLAYGILQSNLGYVKDGTIDTYVETVEIMQKRFEKVIAQFGMENLILKPDCGFGGLRHLFGQPMAVEIVRRKLALLTTQMKKIRNEIYPPSEKSL